MAELNEIPHGGSGPGDDTARRFGHVIAVAGAAQLFLIVLILLAQYPVMFFAAILGVVICLAGWVAGSFEPARGAGAPSFCGANRA